jgi:hypothetical protein
LPEKGESVINSFDSVKAECMAAIAVTVETACCHCRYNRGTARHPWYSVFFFQRKKAIYDFSVLQLCGIITYIHEELHRNG